MRKHQLGVRVSKVAHDNIAADLCRHKTKTKDVIVEAALMNLFYLPASARAKLYARFPDKIFGRPSRAAKTLAALLLLLSLNLNAAEVQPERLADAIRIEEGSNPHWLYGIHHKGFSPLPEVEARKRCLQTIAHAQKDWNHRGDFIEFLSHRYCPANWKSWTTNVKHIYEKNQPAN